MVKHIGKRLTELLAEKKISVTKCASRIGKTNQYLYHVLKSENINTGLLSEILMSMEVSIAEFYGFENYSAKIEQLEGKLKTHELILKQHQSIIDDKNEIIRLLKEKA